MLRGDGGVDLASVFRQRFDAEPTHLSRAPGRVNLIGEHIDYNGLPVLPMAIQREVRLALKPREDGLVRLSDVDETFEPLEFELRPGIEPGAAGDWGNYAKAPANELARRFAIWRGFDGVLESNVPTAAGLASSTALVTAVGLALARINEVTLRPGPFAELMAEAERFTGTRGGSMDHAIAMTAREGTAARVSFNPLLIRHLPVPPDWSFVVADTGVKAEKSGGAQNAYNLRRSQCETALSTVLDEVEARQLTRLRPSGYAALLKALGPDEVLGIGEGVLGGNLLKRFRHVVTEAGRVAAACDRLMGADFVGFAELMDRSHGSLRTDFHVSSAELDELVTIAREGGAVGARLTGAGFGGCIVALADPATEHSVVETIVREYYEARGITHRLQDRVFVARPSGGASFGAWPEV